MCVTWCVVGLHFMYVCMCGGATIPVCVTKCVVGLQFLYVCQMLHDGTTLLVCVSHGVWWGSCSGMLPLYCVAWCVVGLQYLFLYVDIALTFSLMEESYPETDCLPH